MNKLLIGAAGLLFFVGCDGVTSTDTFDTGATDTDNGDTDTDNGTAELSASDVHITWDPGTDGNVDISIDNLGSANGYWLGMSEGAENSGWTGEDCLSGYTTSGGTNYNICHYFTNTGSLTYVHDFADVVQSETTLFNGDLADGLTYFIQLDVDGGAGACYAWGDDTSIYAAPAGCSDITLW